MTERDDITLLREFAATESEAAFAALVSRHLNLVYSVAMRSTGNVHAAQEISQAVFIILARKTNKLPKHVVLSGWLYQTTRLTAANFLRGEIRRQQREQEAYMESTLNEPDASVWPQIAPLLDDALGKLGERDRNAIMLRFFENKNLREVGAALGSSEDAAKMRVNRALEKLRKMFAKRGVTLTATLIAGAVSASSVQAAPMGLAISTVATFKGSAVSVSTLTLVKGTLKLMTYAKLKLAIGITAGILLAGSAVTVAISQISTHDKLTAQQIIQKSLDAYATISSYSDTGKTVIERGNQTETISFDIRLQRPTFYRISWSQAEIAGRFNQDTTFTSNSSKGVVWSDGVGDFLAQVSTDSPNILKDAHTALSQCIGLSGQASTTIPGAFFGLSWPEYGESLLNPTGILLHKQKDERADGVDCFVVSSGKNSGKTLWIGKQDFLVRQIRTVVEEYTAPRSDAEIKEILRNQNIPATPEAIASLKAGMSGIQNMKATTTQTHSNIVVNQEFSPADFAR